MKLSMGGVNYLIGFSLCALTHTVFAGPQTATSAISTVSGKAYVGIFGGAGYTNGFNVDQYGTAYFMEAEGGQLAVDAFGHVSNHSTGFFGAQFGYQVQELQFSPKWSLSLAGELEGFYLGKSSFNGTLFNDTDRLNEHEFDATYPMKRSVFLINTVITLNQPCLLVHPYLGVGIGGAIASIAGADSTQLSPSEPGINHYNANTNDMDTTFAGQIKLGLGYDITNAINVFAEYRWLYLGSTHFTFGSTVYPGHVPTSSWQVNVDPQRSNLASVGIRINL